MCSSCLVRLSNKLTPRYFSNLLSSHCPLFILLQSPWHVFSSSSLAGVLLGTLVSKTVAWSASLFLLLYLCSDVNILERVSLITNIKQYPHLYLHCLLSPYIAIHIHMYFLFILQYFILKTF